MSKPLTLTQQQNLLNAFSHFTTSWVELSEAWRECDGEMFIKDYPFDRSFDEMLYPVNVWERSCREEIEKIPLTDTPFHKGWKAYSIAKEFETIMHQCGLTKDQVTGDFNDAATHVYINDGEEKVWILLHESGWYSTHAVQDSEYSEVFADCVETIEEQLGIRLFPDTVTPPELPVGVPSGSVEVYSDDLTGKAMELAGEWEQRLYENDYDTNEQFAFVVKMAMEGYFVTLCSDGAIDCLYKLPPPTPLPMVVSRQDMANALGINTIHTGEEKTFDVWVAWEREKAELAEENKLPEAEYDIKKFKSLEAAEAYRQGIEDANGWDAPHVSIIY